MATRNVSVFSTTYIAADRCDNVVACLSPDPWLDRTASGVPFVFGTLADSGRYTGQNRGVVTYENNRRVERYQYTFTYDDAQLLDNPGTGLPWVVVCSDISISSEGCLLTGILSTDKCCDGYIDATGDATLLAALDAIPANGPLAVTVDLGATSGYAPAEAEDGQIFMVMDYKANSFAIGLNGCLGNHASVQAGKNYVVVPTSLVGGGATIGTIVDITTINTGSDAVVNVGTSTADGCLHVNVVEQV